MQAPRTSATIGNNFVLYIYFSLQFCGVISLVLTFGYSYIYLFFLLFLCVVCRWLKVPVKGDHLFGCQDQRNTHGSVKLWILIGRQG